jgi:pentatricopeptide repeat protein
VKSLLSVPSNVTRGLLLKTRTIHRFYQKSSSFCDLHRIQSLYNKGKKENAIHQFFNNPDPFAASFLISRQDNIEMAWNLYQATKEKSSLDIAVILSLMTVMQKSRGQWHMFDTVKDDLMTEMKKIDQEKASISYILNKVLEMYAFGDRIDLAHQMLCNMVEKLGIYDIFSFNIVMKAYLKFESNFQMVLKLFEDIKQLELKPTHGTFNYVFESILYQENLDKAFAFLESIGREQSPKFPDQTTISILLRKCRKILDTQTGYMWFDRLTSPNGPYKLEPNIKNFQELIDLACKAGDISSAVNFLEQIGKYNKLKVDDIILTSITAAYVREGNMAAAERLIENMPSQYGIEPSVFQYDAMIKGYKNHGDIARMNYWCDQKNSKLGKRDRMPKKIF